MTREKNCMRGSTAPLLSYWDGGERKEVHTVPNGAEKVIIKTRIFFLLLPINNENCMSLCFLIKILSD